MKININFKNKRKYENYETLYGCSIGTGIGGMR